MRIVRVPCLSISAYLNRFLETIAKKKGSHVNMSEEKQAQNQLADIEETFPSVSSEENKRRSESREKEYNKLRQYHGRKKRQDQLLIPCVASQIGFYGFHLTRYVLLSYDANIFPTVSTLREAGQITLKCLSCPDET